MKPKAVQISVPAMSSLRVALSSRVPGLCSEEWLRASVPTFNDGKSRRVLVGVMRKVGLLGPNFEFTDLAKRWSVDATEAEARREMLISGFGEQFTLEHMSSTRDVLESEFCKYSVKPLTAKGMARSFVALRDGFSSGQQRVQTRTRRHSKPSNPGNASEEVTRDERLNTVDTPTVLRYFLREGKIAELSVPADISAQERKRLFKHIEVDLLLPETDL